MMAGTSAVRSSAARLAYLKRIFSSLSAEGSFTTRYTSSSSTSARVRLQRKIRWLLFVNNFKTQLNIYQRVAHKLQHVKVKSNYAKLAEVHYSEHFNCGNVSRTDTVDKRSNNKQILYTIVTYNSINFLFCALHSCRSSSSSISSERVTFCKHTIIIQDHLLIWNLYKYKVV